LQLVVPIGISHDFARLVEPKHQKLGVYPLKNGWCSNEIAISGHILNLAGGLEQEFYDFPYIGNVIIPTDELIFFRGVGQPPTRNRITV